LVLIEPFQGCTARGSLLIPNFIVRILHKI
jgi:hypothetical protein